jgi:signal transduction histidine kinase
LSSLRSGFRPAWLTFVTGGLVSFATASWFRRDADELDQARFTATVTTLVEELDARSERYAEQLERLGDLVEIRGDLSDADWNELVKKLEPRSNLPAILELAYATNAIMPSRAAVEKLQRSEPELPSLGYPPLSLTRHWAKGISPMPEATAIWLHTPLVATCWWSTVNGRMGSSPRRIIQPSDDEPAATVSFFIPIFATDFLELNALRPKGSRRLRDHRFKGIVIGTLDWRVFLKTALPSTSQQVAFDVFADAANPSQISSNTWMGGSGGTECQVLASGFRPRFHTTIHWPFFRNQWQLVFYSTPQFERYSTRYRAWVALAGGLVLSSMAGGVMAVQIKARMRQETFSRRLTSALGQLKAAHGERERLRQDLHDGTIQSLYALQLGLSRTAAQVSEHSPVLGSRLADYRRNLAAIIRDLRGYILQGEASEGPKGDLATLLTALIRRMRSTTETRFVADVDPDAARRLSGEQAVHLANLAHEAMSNALRHSRARNIRVNLHHAPSHVTLEVRDDGCGFEPSNLKRTGIGLRSMKTRAAKAGGHLALESTTEGGTRVTVCVPIANNPPIAVES